jgi:4-amino-4-deoxy-L-arabinose transferase-like glycosyltransferase
MNSAQQTTTILPADGPLGQGASAPTTSAPRVRVRARHLALGAVMAFSAVLNTYRLSQNGWANAFYSAGVKSMLHSLHNFLFVSFDTGGMITVDKPPLGLWVQTLSAKLFGMTPLSVLLPEAIAGVITVGVLYWAVTPRFGVTAGLASALALTVFPSFVAVSRDNNLDAILILLMTLACGVGLRAIESGRLRTLLGCAALVGLAFNTKTLAAYLVVPGLALGYLVCAPGTLTRRALHLLASGAMLLAVSASWIALVELTPASKRPFVGGSTNDTELGLTFGYNGFGRVGGQTGGPGQIRILLKHGSLADTEKAALRHQALRLQAERRRAQQVAAASGVPVALPPAVAIPPAPHPTGTPHAARPRKPPLPKFLPNGRAREPTAFGGPTGPLRLFGLGLGTQAAWMLPFALIGLIALALWSIGVGDEEASAGDDPDGDRDLPSDGGRRSPRLAGLIVLGGWFLVEAMVLSFSKGIVHPYYLSALGPGTAAMVGGGTVAFVELGARRRLRMALIPLAVAGTVAAQLVLLHEDHYIRWFWPILIAGAALGVLAILTVRRWMRPAMAATLGLLLLAPCAYAASTWEFPVQGTFPAAGPRTAGGYGGLNISPTSARVTKALLTYVRVRHPGSRFQMLTEASDTAASMILLGYRAGAMGGYSGYDPALNGRGLARLVRRGEARYVVLGGAYAERGGNAASTAVLRACNVIPATAWQPRPVNPNALLLFDCKGRESELARQHGTLGGNAA